MLPVPELIELLLRWWVQRPGPEGLPDPFPLGDALVRLDGQLVPRDELPFPEPGQ